MIGLQYSRIVETNPFVILLMRYGLWHIFDIVLVAIVIISMTLIEDDFLQNDRINELRLVYIFPILTGGVRFIVGIYNIFLILKVSGIV